MTTAIQLQRLQANDAEAVLNFERENRSFFEQWIASRGDHYYTLPAVAESIKQADDLARANKEFHFLAWSEHTLVGRLTLRGIETVHYKKASLGYRFSQHHGGRGYATAAVRLVSEFAFRELNLRRLETQIIIDNLASRAIMEKCGFKQFGHAHAAVIRHDQWHDLLHYELHNPSLMIETNTHGNAIATD